MTDRNPYDIAITTPDERDLEQGDHRLVLGRGNMDSVYILSTAELKALASAAFSRMVATQPVQILDNVPTLVSDLDIITEVLREVSLEYGLSGVMELNRLSELLERLADRISEKRTEVS